MNDLRGILSHRSSDSALNVSMQMDIDISLSPSPSKMKEEAVQEGCKADETFSQNTLHAEVQLQCLANKHFSSLWSHFFGLCVYIITPGVIGSS